MIQEPYLPCTKHFILLFCHNEKVLIGGPLIIMEKESIKNEVQLFKSGNSWSFRVTSKDRKELNATKDTMFEKIVDPDKKEIILKRMDAVDPDLEDFMHDFYSEHDELMRRLEES